MRVLVVDIGGSHVKMLVTGESEPRYFDSHPNLQPEETVDQIRSLTQDWRYDAVSIGYPGAVARRGPSSEPGNLGSGWVQFDFRKAFNRPVQVINDAAMQALGAYDGGRMLFLGLGTGVGSTLIANRVIIALELGCLPYRAENGQHGDTLVDHLGKDALHRMGKSTWLKVVHDVTESLCQAMRAHYVVLGGGNAEWVDPLPPGTRRGGNEDAFKGGFRLWEEQVQIHDPARPGSWLVI